VEIDNALKSASKNQKGNVGYLDFVAIVNGFVLVLENKSDVWFLTDYEDTATGRGPVIGPQRYRKLCSQRCAVLRKPYYQKYIIQKYIYIYQININY
jgi:hypothetical protein